MSCEARRKVALALALLASTTFTARADLIANGYELHHPNHVPSAISFDSTNIRASRVTMCLIDWAAYARTPAVYPMFEDLQSANNCGKRGVGDTFVTTLGALEREFSSRGCSIAHNTGYGVLELGCAPAAVVFHESRCGSTLVANMIQSTPGLMMYSESGPVAAMLRSGNITQSQRVHWLRVMVAAMARPIFAALQRPLEAEYQPRYLYIKTQHQVTLSLPLYRAAFPAMPWVYIHRAPVEILMSLFQTADTAPGHDAAPDAHIVIPATSREDYYKNNPCLRTRGDPPDFILSMTQAAQALGADVTSPVDGYTGGRPGSRSARVERVSFEDWCAADLAYVTAAALESAIAARRDVIEQLALGGMSAEARASRSARAAAVQSAWDAIDVRDGAAFAAGVARMDAGVGCVHVRDGLVLDARTETGTVMGIGLGMFIDYSDLPDIVPMLLDTHLRPAVGGFVPPSPADEPHTYRGGAASCGAIAAPPNAFATRPMLQRMLASAAASPWNLTSSALEGMMAVSSMYSKARATASQLGGLKHAPGGIRPFRVAGGGRLRAARPWRNIGEDGRYVSDAAVKQARVWPSLRAAADRFLSPLRRAMLDFNPPFTAEERAAMESYVAKELEDAAMAAAAYEADVWSSMPPVVQRLLAAPATAASTAAAVIGWPQHAVGGGDTAPDARPIESSSLPLGKGYPATFSLQSILQEWHPGIITPPATFGRYSSLRTFDYLRQLEDAHEHRRAEVPFVVRNVPTLNRLVEWWADDDYLIDLLGRDRTYGAEVSDSARFLYYSKSVVKALRAKGGSFVPPTRHVNLKLSAWLQRAYAVGKAVTEEEEDQLPTWWTKASGEGVPVDAVIVADGGNASTHVVPLDALRIAAKHAGVDNVTLPHWPPAITAAFGLPSTRPRVPAPTRRKRALTYLWAGTEPPPGQPPSNEWIRTSFQRMFDPGHELFVENGDAQKGIMCRFGMPGIISEAHWDAGRNFIAVVRGYKRYILLPPDQCRHLNLTRTGPSARQSELDFTDPETIAQLGHVRAIEVILEPGDVLYVPALWMHYIVSLTINAQCNTRSGTPPVALEEMQACGFDMTDVPVEAAGVYASRSAKKSGRAQPQRMPPLTAAEFTNVQLARPAGEITPAASPRAIPTPLPVDRQLTADAMVALIAQQRVADAELGIYSSLKHVAYARSGGMSVAACSSDAMMPGGPAPSLLAQLSCVPTYIERRARAAVGASVTAVAYAWMSSLQCILIAVVALATLQYAARRCGPAAAAWGGILLRVLGGRFGRLSAKESGGRSGTSRAVSADGGLSRFHNA